MSKTSFPTCRKCPKTTSKAGNYTNMILAGIRNPEEFDEKYGMMCGDHAGEITQKILQEKNLTMEDWAKANSLALKFMDEEF